MSLSSSAMAPRIGIVGCGAIGRAVLQAVAEGRLRVPVAGVTSRDAAKARAFLDTLPEPFPYLEREALIGAADLLIEAAGQAVVPDLVRDAIAAAMGATRTEINVKGTSPEAMGSLGRKEGLAAETIVLLGKI